MSENGNIFSEGRTKQSLEATPRLNAASTALFICPPCEDKLLHKKSEGMSLSIRRSAHTLLFQRLCLAPPPLLYQYLSLSPLLNHLHPPFQPSTNHHPHSLLSNYPFYLPSKVSDESKILRQT